MKYCNFALICCAMHLPLENCFSQARLFTTQKIESSVKIDGKLEEPIWNAINPITGFYEWKPNNGILEDSNTRTQVYIFYSDRFVYVGGYCKESTKDSISTELVARDEEGVNDIIGIILDTYNDKINGFAFYVTPYGGQIDSRYSSSEQEDRSWNSIWESASIMSNDGWYFEMKIPYSSLRFNRKQTQDWGLNVVRKRNKAGKYLTWNPVSVTQKGFLNQFGIWTNIKDIEPSLRLSLSPYVTSYANHYPVKDGSGFSTFLNAGMDVKYGINESFTLDMILIPDFGQVQSDNQVLNLSPFEIRFNENRLFFTEGTELFNKGNLFYSRRIGGTPVGYNSVYDRLQAGENVISNPENSKLINAIKISGRTKKGLGIGVFNAITNSAYAEITDSNQVKRKVLTEPFTNYNIAVLDQSLKNNSSISFINTSVLRKREYKDANVSAAVYNINNRSNSINFNGKLVVSQLLIPTGPNKTGYAHYWQLAKTKGRMNLYFSEDIANDKYDINDLGILRFNNYLNHYLTAVYRWVRPTSWYNSVTVEFTATHRRLNKNILNAKTESKFQEFTSGIEAGVQFKNLWDLILFTGYVPRGNDFFEPREQGYVFKTVEKKNLNLLLQSNAAKKYSLSISGFYSLRNPFNGVYNEFGINNLYRFSDKFSVTQASFLTVSKNELGFYQKEYDSIFLRRSILFSRRLTKTVENTFFFKYGFSKNSALTLRLRHYWSNVFIHDLYDLADKGELVASNTTAKKNHQNFNSFNIDAVYNWQFAPGSFLTIVWKNSIFLTNDRTDIDYFQNLAQTFRTNQINSISAKLLYFFDASKIKRKRS
ncbi:MAG: carbohydrate binding family 9 domain-containing protein [Chitinophagales bacterium]|nr:carbohydrate binding family 9 domain-containing protein [Chitinophagales bacterium]